VTRECSLTKRDASKGKEGDPLNILKKRSSGLVPPRKKEKKEKLDSTRSGIQQNIKKKRSPRDERDRLLLRAGNDPLSEKGEEKRKALYLIRGKQDEFSPVGNTKKKG